MRNLLLAGAAMMLLATPAIAGRASKAEIEATRQLNLQAAQAAAPRYYARMLDACYAALKRVRRLGCPVIPDKQPLQAHRDAPVNRSALCISSYVAPFAPFAVMPRAIEALRGEMNTFALCCARFPVRNRSKAKSLLPAMILLSDPVRSRGRAVIGVPGAVGASRHADPTRAATNNIGPKSFMISPP